MHAVLQDCLLILAKRGQSQNGAVCGTRSNSPATPALPAPKRSRPNAQAPRGRIRASEEPELTRHPSRPNPPRPPVNRRAVPPAETHIYPTSDRTSEVEEAEAEVEEAEVEVEDEDSDDEVEDFAVELSYKIYVNKSIRRRKDLPDTTRDALLDLSNLEEVICKEVDLLCKTEQYSTLDIVQRTAFISVAGKKSIHKAHDLEDFGLQQGQVLERMLNSTKEQYPFGKIILTFEIKTLAPTLTRLPSKRKAPETDEDKSSLPPSSPPIAYEKRAGPEKKKSSWTSVLQEQSKVRLDKILYASEWERQLTDQLTCKDKDCTNYENFCWPDPIKPKQHYNVTALQQKTWADAITAGNATLANPPARLLLFWQQEQGPISRDSRASVRQGFQQETKTSLAEIREQIELAQAQSQLQSQQDRIAAMEDRRIQRKESRLRKEEEEEERRRRRAEDEEDRRVRKADRDEERERARQQKLQEEEYRRQLTWSQLPQPPRQSFSYSFQPPFYQPPFYQPHFYQLWPPAPAPASAPTPATQLASQRSSLISTLLPDREILKRFFESKMQNQLPEVVAKIERAWRIVDSQDWTVNDLKEMEDRQSETYRLAREAGISDGLARNFAKDLRAFKDIHRQEEEAAKILQAEGHV
ncbi:hypothetical protein GP486_005286 [Trichoglossum hirsutum]|uniref:Uncharacterized protein n=1 Tax=Trichoglossum hirsutum TaxID=265104 RepID=A0A9P8L9I3_9PEZI|nr:hypothetical protein GP486_005286 [Trichoglossum hirsutum]